MELVFNIWFIISLKNSHSQKMHIKPYFIDGEDNVKFDLLSKLAEGDYLSVESINFFEDCMTKELSLSLFDEFGLHQERIDEFIDTNLNYLVEHCLKEISNYLPKEVYKEYKNKLVTNPLFVCTLLMENQEGEMRPFTTESNRKWCFSEAQKYLKSN